MLFRNFFIIPALILIPVIIYPQGCSDAGFCTMGAMKPDQPFSRKVKIRLRSIEIGIYRGQTLQTPIVYIASADFNFSLNQKNSFQIKVPYQAVRGRLANTHGIGDLSLSYTRNIFHAEKYDINATAGCKIASNNSNLKQDGKPLPMYYQTSLGTYDFVAGLSFLSRDWLIATGIQHPFNTNGNQFTWAQWPDFTDTTYLHDYPAAKDLKRGTDIMMRIERNFRYSRFNVALGALPIFRITKDEITDPNTGVRQKLDGSTGLALTGLITLGYRFNVRTGIKFLFGMKFVKRQVDPDGLTRHAVMTASWYYRF